MHEDMNITKENMNTIKGTFEASVSSRDHP